MFKCEEIRLTMNDYQHMHLNVSNAVDLVRTV